MSDDTSFELWYSSEGVSITEYQTSDDAEPTVEEEWWFTWPELFTELTGIAHSPTIRSQP